ncbi:MAG: carbohydrate kinase [Flavisolibacter sp.]|nr:carbohydrate kinase [Flavisolibacter sp.]
MNFGELFTAISNLRVGIIGDVMLDTYMWGNVERISPEAPVPIVALNKKEYRMGGAGNVALNVRSLGATAFVLTVTGDDDDARALQNLFAAQNINTQYSFCSSERITTNKIRIISRNQQMMRLDTEITYDLSAIDEERLIKQVHQFIVTEQPDIIILQDYNKGVLTEKVIASVIRQCREANVLTAVDPKRKNFFSYKGVDLFKPNLKEVKEALNILAADVDLHFLKHVHTELYHQLQQNISLITLSEKGVFYQQNGEAAIIPSHLRTIADVSGAGDTVIAVATLVYAAKKDVRLMAEIANIAGGLVCEEVGTAAINGEKLLQECATLLS